MAIALASKLKDERGSLINCVDPVLARFPDLVGVKESHCQTFGPLLSLIGRGELNEADYEFVIQEHYEALLSEVINGETGDNKVIRHKKRPKFYREIEWLSTVDAVIDKILESNKQIPFPRVSEKRLDIDYIISQLYKIRDGFFNKHHLTPVSFETGSGVVIDYPYRWTKKTSEYIVGSIDKVIDSIKIADDKRLDAKKVVYGRAVTNQDKLATLAIIAELPHNKTASRVSLVSAAKCPNLIAYNRSTDTLFVVFTTTENSVVFDRSRILCEAGSYSIKKPTKFIFTQSFEAIIQLTNTNKRKSITSVQLTDDVEIIACK